MSSRTMSHGALWMIDARIVAYALIGAALFGILGLFSTPLPGADSALRPAFALVTFFGYSFGPLVGLVVGLLGNSVLEQLGGMDVGTYWMRSVETGIVGFIAGLATLYVGGLMRGTLARRALGGAIAGVVATVVGFLSVFAEIVTSQAAAGTVLSDQYLPLVIGGVLVSAVLVPILVYAWDPLSEAVAG